MNLPIALVGLIVPRPLTLELPAAVCDGERYRQIRSMCRANFGEPIAEVALWTADRRALARRVYVLILMIRAESLLPSRKLARAGSLVTSNQLLVLCYHGVEDPMSLAAQMDELLEHRIPVSLKDVRDSIAHGARLPRRSVLVTFDDGDRSVLDNGLDVLVRRGIPGALFVVSGLVGTDQPFWWDEVADLVQSGAVSPHVSGDSTQVVRALKKVSNEQRLSAIDDFRNSIPSSASRRSQLTETELRTLDESGITIGSHTVSHPCLDMCSVETVASELTESRAQLESMLGREVKAFAYPNGNTSPAVQSAIRAAGYDIAFGFDHRVSKIPIPNPMHVSRIRVDSTTAIARFRLLISGAHSAVHHARGRS